MARSVALYEARAMSLTRAYAQSRWCVVRNLRLAASLRDRYAPWQGGSAAARADGRPRWLPVLTVRGEANHQAVFLGVYPAPGEHTVTTWEVRARAAHGALLRGEALVARHALVARPEPLGPEVTAAQWLGALAAWATHPEGRRWLQGPALDHLIAATAGFPPHHAAPSQRPGGARVPDALLPPAHRADLAPLLALAARAQRLTLLGCVARLDPAVPPEGAPVGAGPTGQAVAVAAPVSCRPSGPS